jgi:hypothetical protein
MYGVVEVAAVSDQLLVGAVNDACALVEEREFQRGYLGVKLFSHGNWFHKSPGICRLIDGLGCGFQLNQVRLLCQEALSGKFAAHTDDGFGLELGDIARFHVPLVSDKSATVSVWESDGQIDRHLSVGRVYYFDLHKPHAISNDSLVDRLHLAIDVVVDEQTLEWVSRGIRKWTRNDTIMASLLAAYFCVFVWCLPRWSW